jgi:hypothetical protein
MGGEEEYTRRVLRGKLIDLLDGEQRESERWEEVVHEFDPLPDYQHQHQHQQHQRMFEQAAERASALPRYVIPNEQLEEEGSTWGAAVVETTRERLLRLEAEFERGTVEEALQEYREVQETLFRTGKAANLPVVKRQLFAWCVRAFLALSPLCGGWVVEVVCLG